MGGVIYSIHSWDPPRTEPLNNPIEEHSSRTTLTLEASNAHIRHVHQLRIKKMTFTKRGIAERACRSIGILIDIRVILGTGLAWLEREPDRDDKGRKQ